MKYGNGIYPIYKPVGPSSFKIITELRKITGVKKIGHAGTLDPLASGVLVVAIGKEFTKKLGEHVAKEKEYVADIKLGETSTTDDSEGIIKSQITKSKLQANSKAQISKDKIEEVLKKFVGKIQQVPPIYSAIKMEGERAYKMARSGKAPEMKLREVEIKDIEIIEYSYPYLKLKVTTSKGVYIRSLARDIGEKLGTGGYLAGLERTRVGQFRKEDSLAVEEFKAKIQSTKDMPS